MEVVPCIGVLWGCSLSGCGGRGWGFLWAMDFYEGVKDYIGEYKVLVIQMAVVYVLGMNVKPFNRV